MIKLVGVEKTLGKQPVLRGVDLTIPTGKLTTIIGRSGEGKSVLLKHIIGLMQPDRGEVWIDGTNIARLKGQALNEVRKKFAMLFQGAALFDSMTVFENVAFPLREKLRLKGEIVTRRVEEKLEQVGLKGMGHKFPAELSGGMRKRAGLARALVMEPEIILFDEPTTGLDPLMERVFNQVVAAERTDRRNGAIERVCEDDGRRDSRVYFCRRDRHAEGVADRIPLIGDVMERAKLELMVGIFVLVGIACLGYLSIKLGKLEVIGGHNYPVEAEFTSASGLKPGASVEIAGVEVGRVRHIGLSSDRALVALAIQDGVKLYSDTIASIKTRGIIGDKYLALSVGGSGDPLKPGDKIRDTESGLDLEELVSQYVHGKVN